MSREWQLLKRGAIEALAARGFLLFTGFFASAWIARMMPDAALGPFYLAVQAATLLGLIGALGTPTAVQRFVSEQNQANRSDGVWQAIRSVQQIALCAWLAAAIGFALLWPWLANRLAIPQAALPWVLLLSLAVLFEEQCAACLRGLRRYRLGTWLHGGPRQFLLLLLFAGASWEMAEQSVPFELGLTARLLATGVGMLLGVLALELVLRRMGARRGESQAELQPRAVLAVSAPMALHLLAAHFLASVDLWTVGFFLDEEATAGYGSVLRLVLLLGTCLAVMNAVLPSLVAPLAKAGRIHDAEPILRRAATATGFAVLFGFVVLSLFPGQILQLAFGRFTELGLILTVLAGGQCINVAAGSPGWVLQMSGHQRVLARITLFSLGLNLGLNLLLVGPYDLLGVAVATAIGLTVQNLLMTYAVRRLLGIRCYSYLNPMRAFRA